MVKRILNILNKEFTNINQAAILLGFFNLISQVLGLFRDRVFAHYLGTSADLDIYYAAFRVPDFIYVSVASLMSITVLIPFLNARLHKDDKEGARVFLNQIFSTFFALMFFVGIIAFFLMPKISYLIAPGFNSLDRIKLIETSRIMLLSPILLGLSNLFGSITQLYKKFFVFSLSPIFYNLGIITGALYFYFLWGIKGLALGVVLGSLLHFLIQLWAATSYGFSPKLSFKVDFKEVKKVFKLSLPRTLGLALNNLALLVILAFASTMPEGSISIFNYSYHIETIPLSIIGLSFATAAFPMVTHFFTIGDKVSFVKHLFLASRQTIFWTVPIIFLFIVLRAQIVRVLLGTGNFSWSDTKLTAAALALFSISLLAQSLILILVRGYYAAGKTKKPFWINLIFSSLIIILAFLLPKFYANIPGFKYFIESLLRTENIKGTEMLMLPLAYSIGTILNFSALWFVFKKDFLSDEFKFYIKEIKKTFFHSVGSAFFIGLVAYLFLGIFAKVFNLDTFWGVLMQGFLSGILGIAVGVLILKLMKNEELDEIIKSLKGRFWKAKVVIDPIKGGE